LAYLLHRPALDEAADPVAVTTKFMAGLDEELEIAALHRLAELSNGSIRVETGGTAVAPVCPVPEPAATLAARPFHGDIDNGWRVTSFTGLTSSKAHGSELPDRDADHARSDESASTAEAAPAGIFAFPRGAQAGTCLHAILERVDFAALSQDGLLALAEEQLLAHGFAPEWTATVAAMVTDTLAAPLTLGSETVTLGRLLPGSWRPELEFMLPLDSLAPATLAAVFRRHGIGGAFPEKLAELGFSEVKGMLRGFIDLVFRVDGRYYLLDWKSNHLGNRRSDYAAGQLSGVMEREFYTLQYHLYSVALHRFLSVKIPGYDYDRQFGGVFYLFLRGIARDAGDTGVFSARPCRELILELSDLISRYETDKL
jgi:exodeoxyribonuclease V beta subunit